MRSACRSQKILKEVLSLTKTELIDSVAERSGLNKIDAGAAVNAFVDAVIDELAKGGTVQIVGFGSFEVVERAERTGRNPKTNSPMLIPACKSPKFRAGRALKDVVNS